MQNSIGMLFGVECNLNAKFYLKSGYTIVTKL
jgi:hypothetical protein